MSTALAVKTNCVNSKYLKIKYSNSRKQICMQIGALSTKKLNHRHFIHFLTTIQCLMSHEGFPWILVRGHGFLRPSHPPPPWPRGAARRRHRGRFWLREAAVCRLGSRGPMAQARRQNPTEPKGRKVLRKFWHVKSQSFGNCGQNPASNVLRPSTELKQTSWFCILLKSCQPCWQSRWFGERTINWNTNQNLKTVPYCLSISPGDPHAQKFWTNSTIDPKCAQNVSKWLQVYQTYQTYAFQACARWKIRFHIISWMRELNSLLADLVWSFAAVPKTLVNLVRETPAKSTQKKPAKVRKNPQTYTKSWFWYKGKNQVCAVMNYLRDYLQWLDWV